MPPAVQPSLFDIAAQYGALGIVALCSGYVLFQFVKRQWRKDDEQTESLKTLVRDNQTLVSNNTLALERHATRFETLERQIRASPCLAQEATNEQAHATTRRAQTP